MRKIFTRKIRICTIIALSVLIIGVILYALADRYLIEHVEIADTTLYENSASEDNSSEAVNSQVSTQGDSSGSVVKISNDWNFISDTTSVSVKKVTSGSGNNTLTYFVADVTISEGTNLRAAFAKNRFGRNIIEDTSVIAKNNNAIFAINGDYYGFRGDGIVIRNGVIYRNVPARVGLAIYKDGSMKVYNEKSTNAQALLDEGVYNTLSFGPAILENSVIPANINTAEVDTNFGNHSIQGDQPRTGIGIINNNHFVFIVADGRSTGYSKGVTLKGFADIFKDLGCTTAYNLDGGGSSTMYFNGRVVNNPLGKNQERGVSDILYIQ